MVCCAVLPIIRVTSVLGTCLPQIKVDEVLRLVGYIGPKVAAHDAVPGSVVLLVKLFLNEGRNILRDEERHGCHGCHQSENDQLDDCR